MKKLRKHFFDFIRERHAVLDQIKREPFVNIVPPKGMWDFLDYVGNFLMEYGAITYKDFNVARDMLTDYEERVDAIFPQSR